MLPAACRKMWVSLTVGTAPEATSSANGLPAPTGASWSASPTRTTCVDLETARRSVTSSSRFAIEVSSTISRSQLSGSSSSWVGPSPGIQPSAECTVRAAIPLASVIRIAARPVGATSSTLAPWPVAIAPIVLIDAVLPVPGPPVIRDSRCSNAATTPARCSSVSSVPRSPSDGDRRRPPDELRTSPATRSASSASSSAVARR